MIPIIDSDERAFRIGRGWQVRDGSDVTIFGVGLMLHAALEAAEQLGITRRLLKLKIDKHALTRE